MKNLSYLMGIFLLCSSPIFAQEEVTTQEEIKMRRFTADAGVKVPYIGFYLGAGFKPVSAIELSIGVDFNPTYTYGRWIELKYFIGESFKKCVYKKHQFFIISQINSSTKGNYLEEDDNDNLTEYKIHEGLYLNLGFGYGKNVFLGKDITKKQRTVGFFCKAYFQGAIKPATYTLVKGNPIERLEKSLKRELGNYFIISAGVHFVF
ncbi:MAG TPA: hypothetical protein PLP27_08590 [Crocinitomicaceae bacterium]|nr:hypothetical protein [Crocinitomicaceae bacterium]